MLRSPAAPPIGTGMSDLHTAGNVVAVAVLLFSTAFFKVRLVRATVRRRRR